jgi:hypothetical protein
MRIKSSYFFPRQFIEFILLISSFPILNSCVEEEKPIKSYAVTLKAEGSNLSSVGSRSKQHSFDVSPVPRIHWQLDHQYWGDDTLHLFASQIADSTNPVIVTVSVAHNDDPVKVFSDTGVAEARISVFLEK